MRIKPLFDDLCKKYEDTAIVYTFPLYNEDQGRLQSRFSHHSMSVSVTGEAFDVREVPTFIVMDNG